MITYNFIPSFKIGLAIVNGYNIYFQISVFYCFLQLSGCLTIQFICQDYFIFNYHFILHFDLRIHLCSKNAIFHICVIYINNLSNLIFTLILFTVISIFFSFEFWTLWIFCGFSTLETFSFESLTLLQNHICKQLFKFIKSKYLLDFSALFWLFSSFLSSFVKYQLLFKDLHPNSNIQKNVDLILHVYKFHFLGNYWTYTFLFVATMHNMNETK